ncbi:MAG: hypothetical protein P1U39_08400 [Legionellaceae bacterium]|nr:hypothetical protein [Legionellaceae bacterium]
MKDIIKFPLGQHQACLNTPGFSRFKKILIRINGKGSFKEDKEDHEENLFFYLNPKMNKMTPHLYTETEGQDTYLKYGMPDQLDSVTLATYNPSVLVDQHLILDLRALEDVRQRVAVQQLNTDRTNMTDPVSEQEHGVNVHFDFNFFVMCGAVGGVLLLAGALALNPVVAIVGTCALAVGVIGMGYHRFFSDDLPEPDESSCNLTHT